MATIRVMRFEMLHRIKPLLSSGLLMRTQQFSYMVPAKYSSVGMCKMCGMVSSKLHTKIPEAKTGDIDKDITENLENVRQGDFNSSKVTNPDELQHFRKTKEGDVLNSMAKPGKAIPMGSSTLPHPIWSEEETHNVEITHKTPEGFVDNLAYTTVKLMRGAFDIVSGYNRTTIRNEKMWLNRIIFLETVAGVPGMVAAMVRHLHSLRRMRRDHGWIHTLLEEAENERMHLMTALQIRKPGPVFRYMVVIAQGSMVTYFSLAYLISPKYCHRFVGYLEEEAVKTYTKCLEDIEYGHLHIWKTKPAPEVAKVYWSLPVDATLKDVILAIRADEAHHRVVNHTLASIKSDDYNPYKPGQ